MSIKKLFSKPVSNKFFLVILSASCIVQLCLYLFTYGKNNNVMEDDHLPVLTRHINLAESINIKTGELKFSPFSFENEDKNKEDGIYRTKQRPNLFYLKDQKIIPLLHGEHISALPYYLFQQMLQAYSPEITLLFFNVIMNTLTFILFAFLIKTVLNTQIALLTTLITSIDPIFISSYHHYITEIFLTPIFLLSLLFLKKKSKHMLFLGAFTIGIGLSLKITFLWLLLTLPFLTSLSHLKLLLKEYKLPVFSGLLLGISPLLFFVDFLNIYNEIFVYEHTSYSTGVNNPIMPFLDLIANKLSFLSYDLTYDKGSPLIIDKFLYILIPLMLYGIVLLFQLKNRNILKVKRILIASLVFLLSSWTSLSIVYSNDYSMQEYIFPLFLSVNTLWGIIIFQLIEDHQNRKRMAYLMTILIVSSLFLNTLRWSTVHHNDGTNPHSNIAPVKETIIDLLKIKSHHPIIAAPDDDLWVRFEAHSNEKIKPYYLNQILGTIKTSTIEEFLNIFREGTIIFSTSLFKSSTNESFFFENNQKIPSLEELRNLKGFSINNYAVYYSHGKPLWFKFSFKRLL
jgi:hypothetical protein